MWRRLNGWSRDQTISDPMLFDTTMEETYLETIPEVDSLKSARSSMAMPGLPDLPFRAVEPLQTVQQEADEDRNSSVYSQPSPHIRQEPPDEATPTTEEPSNAAPDIHRASSLYSAVSPLNTPRASGDLSHYEDHEISPIETAPPMPQLPKQYSQQRSQLPVPRKAIPDTGAKMTGKRTDTRWDDYSGEPTTSEKGKESAVKPGTKALEIQYPDLKERTRQILAGLRERGTATQQDAGNESPPAQVDPLDDPPQREPWKGASGRTTLVKPVRNNPAARLEPIQIPVNKNTRVEPTTRSTNRVVIPSSSTSKPVPAQSSEDMVKPPVPLRVGKNSPAVRSPVTAEPPQSLQSPFRSPQYPDAVHGSVMVSTSNDEPSAGSSSGPLTPLTPTPTRPAPPPPPMSESKNDFLPTNNSPTLGTVQPQPRSDSLQPVNMANDDPSSRFSWTTYATTVTDSPPTTPRADANTQPVPRVPAAMPTPLVMRKRPLQAQARAQAQAQAQAQPQTSPTANHFPPIQNARVVVRKPTPADRRRASSLLSAASDLSKSLPQCPPEIEAPDKISSLEARMEEFARRKRNVNKLIKQLKSGVQPSAIAFDLRTREEVKRTIKGLEGELADIIQEEHDVGMRLHRVQRKRDRDEMYENPTGLWIRRITSYNGQ